LYVRKKGADPENKQTSERALQSVIDTMPDRVSLKGGKGRKHLAYEAWEIQVSSTSIQLSVEIRGD